MFDFRNNIWMRAIVTTDDKNILRFLPFEMFWQTTGAGSC